MEGWRANQHATRKATLEDNFSVPIGSIRESGQTSVRQEKSDQV
jgi:hypothetical protein